MALRVPAKSTLFTIKADITITTTNRSHTLLPSQPPTDHTVIVKIVPYEAFACYRAEDVVLRESYKPKTRGKLYYEFPQSKPRENYFGCDFFLWKEERVRLVFSSPGASTTPSYSPGPSTPPSYSPGPSRNAECANCKLLIGKLQVLEATLEMYMHPEKHTIDSTALLHELYNDMGNLVWNSLSFNQFSSSNVIPWHESISDQTQSTPPYLERSSKTSAEVHTVAPAQLEINSDGSS
ncbi:hypothetical protein Tco_0105247 [Tanacetum coccineum]